MCAVNALSIVTLAIVVSLSLRKLGNRITDSMKDSRGDEPTKGRRAASESTATGPLRTGALPVAPGTPPASAEAFARASRLDNDPLNQ